MFFVVCFDVSDDKKRYRVVKKLKGHCIRVQKSVFECPELTEKQFLKLKAELEKVIDEATDTVRFYPKLCNWRVCPRFEARGAKTYLSTSSPEQQRRLGKIANPEGLRKRAKTTGNCFTKKVNVKQLLSIEQLLDIKRKFIFVLFRSA